MKRFYNANHAFNYYHDLIIRKGIDFDNTKPDGQFRKDVTSSIFNVVIPNFEFTSLSKGIRNTYNKVKLKKQIFRNNG